MSRELGTDGQDSHGIALGELPHRFNEDPVNGLGKFQRLPVGR